MSALSGQRAVIFGGSSGAGFAAAQALLADGAKVIITSRDRAGVEDAARRLGPGAEGVAVDGTDAVATEAFFERIGEVDHLAITAGSTTPGGPFHTMTMDAFRAPFEGKFWVQMNAAHAGARRVRRGGSITIVSGGAAHKAMPGMVNIAAVNGAIEAVVPPLSVELAPTRVNAISPGTLATTYWRGVPEERLQAIFGRMAAALPAGRVGTAEDIASAILFLVRSSFVTGIVLRVDGGLPHANLT